MCGYTTMFFIRFTNTWNRLKFNDHKKMIQKKINKKRVREHYLRVH